MGHVWSSLLNSWSGIVFESGGPRYGAGGAGAWVQHVLFGGHYNSIL